MAATELNLEGTPWNSDQEIVDFALQKRNELGYEWEDVLSLLNSEGLDKDHAEAIISNLREQEEVSAKQDINERKWIAGVLSFGWAILAVLFIRPLSYMISPEYGRIIFIAIIGLGLSFINQYRKGEN